MHAVMWVALGVGVTVVVIAVIVTVYLLKHPLIH